MTAVVKKERTFVVTLLAILSGVVGILSLLDAARYMGWLPIAMLGEMKFFLPSAQWFAALMALLVAVIYFVVASWLWNLNPSGWLFVVIITIINLIFLFLAIFGQTAFSDVAVQITLNAIVLILALLPSTKVAFAPAPSPETADEAPEAKQAVAEKQAEAAKPAATEAAKEADADAPADVSDAPAEPAADSAEEIDTTEADTGGDTEKPKGDQA
jgi:signal transduction histidine kinase